VAQNSIFTAPIITTQIELAFQLTVTNEDVTTSEADEINITVNPASTYPHPNEEPQTCISYL